MERELQRSAEHAGKGPGPFVGGPTQVEKKATHTGERPGGKAAFESAWFQRAENKARRCLWMTIFKGPLFSRAAL